MSENKFPSAIKERKDENESTQLKKTIGWVLYIS